MAEMVANNASLNKSFNAMNDRVADLECYAERTDEENRQFRSFMRVISEHPNVRDWLIGLSSDRNNIAEAGPVSYPASPDSEPDLDQSQDQIATHVSDEADNTDNGAETNAQETSDGSSAIKNEDGVIDDGVAGSVILVHSNMATPEPTPEPPKASKKRKRASAQAVGIGNRRVNHNLDAIMVSEETLMPSMAVTDTELVVYLFRTLRRPIVTLRLRARGWGPHKIATVLNEHREVNPPYLKNTASVMSITALRRGERLNGPDWGEENAPQFVDADEKKATELIAGPTNKPGLDCNVLDLCKKLKKHPEGDDAGLFTRCVKYCVENQLECRLSAIHEVASKLA
ncbi:hypothetical protein BCR34DRAFT_87362 [Clohesyomyces aquaticus]|uniref:Uncharacterized protein n=1 Tax=Clohesyomyces aquaticus TaxID=1231657 RepID=A0A1Y2A325_9PLEO|nr:hypothetical protein BCR34DRAFT_87362 [Clohesyomyces aquaticus]